MFIGAHKTIAENVYTNLRWKHNILLSYNYFIWGNIAPDLKIDFINEKHYQQYFYDKLKAAIIDMADTPMTLAEFSYKAGIICHYLSDMFCYPHEQNWNYGGRNTIEHILFEEKQVEISKNKIYSIQFAPNIKEFTDEYVEFFLKYLINEYKKCIDYNNDMIWSITACYKYIESSLFHMFKYNIIKI